MLRLVVENTGAEFLLTGQDYLIGRSEQCDVLVEIDTISARHGICRASATGYAYTDLGSRNGSALLREGQQVPLATGQPVDLRPGDMLLLGDADPPVRVAIHEGVSPYAPAARPDRTRLARTPLADLLHAPPADLTALAARVIDARDASALAGVALEFLRSVSGGWNAAVVLDAAGVHERAGDKIPPEVASIARDARQVVQSNNESGMVVAAPLIAHEAWLGYIAAWSPDGGPTGFIRTIEIASPLVALAASNATSRIPPEPPEPEPDGDPVGDSPAFVRAVSLCRQIAPADISVLLTGETGTGKEVLARAIHGWSPRAAEPFVAINCAAIPAGLLESELFGHVRGAFTGAATDRAGTFERARGGTLLLDEIGEMPAELQARLLRVVEDHEVRPVGGDEARPVDVRILAATHRDLDAMVGDGRFREDLLYRLNTVTVRIPPLRERGEDILVLAHHLLDARARRAGKRIRGFTPEAIWRLLDHPFRGNVRELRNEIDRAVALTADGRPISPSALSERVAATGSQDNSDPDQPRTLKRCLAIAERFAVEAALARSDGNVTRAAKELGLSRAGLHKILARHGLRRE